MTKKRETFKTKEQVEKDGNINLSVGTQKLIKVRLIGGKYDGIVTEVPALKGENMIGYGKAEKVGPNAKVIPPDQHENEARKLAKKRKDAEAKAEK